MSWRRHHSLLLKIIASGLINMVEFPIFSQVFFPHFNYHPIKFKSTLISLDWLCWLPEYWISWMAIIQLGSLGFWLDKVINPNQTIAQLELQTPWMSLVACVMSMMNAFTMNMSIRLSVKKAFPMNKFRTPIPLTRRIKEYGNLVTEESYNWRVLHSCMCTM